MEWNSMQVIIRSRTRGRSRSKQARAVTTKEIVQLIYTISSGRTCIGRSGVTQDVQQPATVPPACQRER
jgi:hypothetical protein